MLGLHLASRPILRRAFRSPASRPSWLSATNIVRFEAGYYVALFAYACFARAESVWIPLAVLGVIHVAGWLFTEVRRTALASVASVLSQETSRLERILAGIQVFDLAEALALAYMGWKLILPFS